MRSTRSSGELPRSCKSSRESIRIQVPTSFDEARSLLNIPSLVLFYFARSPFFDETSNNNVIFTQAMNNQAMYPYVTTRALFEERLRSMPGLEFVVAQDPSEGDTKQTHSGVWVIKKQRRRKRAGMTDEITPISAYFVMGENVYMAPSLMSVLSSRLVR